MGQREDLVTLLSRNFEQMKFIGDNDSWWELDDGRELHMTPGGSFEVFRVPPDDDDDDRLVLVDQLETDEIREYLRIK